MGTWVAVTVTMPQCLRGVEETTRDMPDVLQLGVLFISCRDGYDALAKRFNKCMESVHRAMTACPPHTNDTGRMYSHYARNPDGELDRFAADFSPGRGAAQGSLPQHTILSGRLRGSISYADQREKLGPFVFASLVALFALWCCVLGNSSHTLRSRSRVETRDVAEDRHAKVEATLEKGAKYIENANFAALQAAEANKRYDTLAPTTGRGCGRSCERQRE